MKEAELKEKEEKKNEKKFQVKPVALKCWPEISLYIQKIRVSLTIRPILEHGAEILIIPFEDTKFSLYPGNIINRCSINYRE